MPSARNKWPHRGCVGASVWEARQRYLTTAQSSIMAGLLRITNHGFSATAFPRTQIRHSAATDSGWYDDRTLFVIHSGYAQDSRGRATCTPLRNRIQAIKNYAAHSCSCRGFRVGSPPAKFDHSQFEYNGRPFTNHESRFFLGLRCGIPPRQTQDGITTAYHWS